MMRRVSDFLAKLEDRLTLRQQIGIATAILCLAIAATLAAISADVSRDKIEALIAERMQNSAVRLADRLDRFMFERFREVQLVAEMGEISNDWSGPPETIRANLEQLQRLVPDYAWLGFVTADGLVQAATGGLLEGVSVSQRSWFIHGLQAPAVEDVHDAVLLAKLLPPNANGEPHRFVDVAVPLHDETGKKIGVLGAHLNWAWADKLRRESILPNPNGPATDFIILSKAGLYLSGGAVGQAAIPADRLTSIQNSRAGWFLDDGFLTGYGVSDGYESFRGLDWLVMARRPAALAMDTARDIGWTILGFGALAAIVGVLIAIFIASRISRSVRTLIVEADKIGRDPNASMLPRLQGSVEVHQLTAALRSLLRRLDTAEERKRAAELRETENAVRHAADVQQLRVLADTDQLTQLPNRRAFLATARDAMQYFKRYQRGFATLVIDIDKFKQVNDNYGHAAGDAVIKRVAEVIASAIRETDKAARFGGEEFVVLLREIDAESVRTLAERIRTAVEATSFSVGEREVTVSVSIGISVVATEDRDIDDVIARADEGLYMAKNTGRNRIFFMPFAQSVAEQRVA